MEGEKEAEMNRRKGKNRESSLRGESLHRVHENQRDE